MATAASRLTAFAAHSPPVLLVTLITRRRLCGPGRRLGPEYKLIRLVLIASARSYRATKYHEQIEFLNEGD